MDYGQGARHCQGMVQYRAEFPFLPALVRGSLTADASALDRPFYQAGPSPHQVAVI